MNQNKLKYLIILVILVLFTSCASFNRSIDNINLTKSTIKNIEGNFENVPFVKFNNRINKDTNYFFNGSLSGRFSTELDRNMNELINEDRTDSFELKILDNQFLEIIYLKEKVIQNSQIIPFKLKKDGFLYLKNKNVKAISVPFLFGAIDIKKIRISKNSDGYLISEVYNHRSGAVLLIMFLDFTTTERRYIYRSTK